MEKLLKYAGSNERGQVPTEILAEFLSCIMLKNYEMALRYCTEILTQEPNNLTAQEFYPLIVKKLEMIKNDELDSSSESSESDSTNSNSDSSFYNDAEDIKSSSDSSDGNSILQETDEDFRPPSNTTSQMPQTSSTMVTTMPNTSQNQETATALSRRILNEKYQTCKLSSAPKLIRPTTTARNTKSDDTGTMSSKEIPQKLKKPQLLGRNNHF